MNNRYSILDSGPPFIPHHLDAAYEWTLTHVPSGHGLSESGDFSCRRLVIWGTDHVVSPEVYVQIDLAPGETFKWKRSYHFF
jgi:hypothetical protein